MLGSARQQPLQKLRYVCHNGLSRFTFYFDFCTNISITKRLLFIEIENIKYFFSSSRQERHFWGIWFETFHIAVEEKSWMYSFETFFLLQAHSNKYFQNDKLESSISSSGGISRIYCDMWIGMRWREGSKGVVVTTSSAKCTNTWFCFGSTPREKSI